MTPETYYKLQEIFTNFNNSCIVFYDELAKLVPTEFKPAIIQGLRPTLNNSNAVFKQVSEILFSIQSKDENPSDSRL